MWSSLVRLFRQRWVLGGVEAIALAILVMALGAFQTRKHLRGTIAPDFELTDLSGKRVSLHDYRHKKVLLHFFATWCGVCRLELPSVEGLHKNLEPDEVLLAVVEDSADVEAVRRYAQKHELSYPILLGAPEILRAYRVQAFPTNYFLNGDGTIDSSSVGLSTRVGMALRLWRAHAE